MAYYDDRENKTMLKVIKKGFQKFIFIIFVTFLASLIILYMYSRKVNKLMMADIQIETAKLENSIKDFKNRTGSFPVLKGNENNLKSLKSTNENYDFSVLYGSNELYAIPENLEKERPRVNKIVEKRDNTGGWVYNSLKGEIKPNIE